MDENPPSNELQIPTVPTRPLSYWVKKFLACNPFYLVSAALLLYGFYLVSSDANFPGREVSQLGFNYNFDWEFLFAVPLLWVVLWSIHWRHSDFLNRQMPSISRILLTPPVMITFLAMTRAGNPVFLVLTASTETDQTH